MKNQPLFPPGILFSVAPENFFALHQIDENSLREFDWVENRPYLTDFPFVQVVFNYLKRLRK